MAVKIDCIRILYKCIDKLLTLICWIGAGILLWIFLQVFLIASFRIPTDSMEPTLLEGDAVLVEKCSMGARLFDVNSSLKGEQGPIYRTLGLRGLKRNDVIVFNNPCPHHWRKMEMDIMQYYVKRCIALPGDVFSIENGRFKVSGHEDELGLMEAQDEFRNMIKQMNLPTDSPLVRAYPGDSLIGWTAINFGPFYIPKAGDSIPMNRRTFLLYRDVIEWEQNHRLTIQGKQVCLNSKPISGYRFKKSYYFATGDKASNSKDSRYWGLLPEEYIVGRVCRIWKSVDPWTDKIRWSRIMKKVE